MCSAVQLCSDLCSHRCFWRFTERLTRQQPTNNGNQRQGWLPSTGFFLNPSFSEAYTDFSPCPLLSLPFRPPPPPSLLPSSLLPPPSSLPHPLIKTGGKESEEKEGSRAKFKESGASAAQTEIKEAQRKVPILRYIKDWVRVQNTRPQIIIFILTLSNDYHAQGVPRRCARGLAFTTQWIMRERMRTLLTCNHWRSHDPPLWPALAALVPLTSRRHM